jgi:hypothetical protein
METSNVFPASGVSPAPEKASTGNLEPLKILGLLVELASAPISSLSENSGLRSPMKSLSESAERQQQCRKTEERKG